MTKQQWRARLLAARRSRSDAERAVARGTVSAHLLESLTGSSTVCAYHPLPTEPLAADLPELLAGIGLRVLVPVAAPGAALDWCDFGGPLIRGALGIAEPSGPRLGPLAIRSAGAVLVPALAVDRSGVRLGRGGGHYDRSLALLAGGIRPRLIAVVFDDELVESLPADPHDVPVTEVVTPDGGLRHVAQPGTAGASSN